MVGVEPGPFAPQGCRWEVTPSLWDKVGLAPSQDNPWSYPPPSPHFSWLMSYPSSFDLCPLVYLSLMTNYPVPCGPPTSSVAPIRRHVDHCKFFQFIYVLSKVYWNFRRKKETIRVSGTSAYQTIPFTLISDPVHHPWAQIVRLPLSAFSCLLAPSSVPLVPPLYAFLPLSCFQPAAISSRHTSWGYYPAGHTDLTWGHCNLIVLTSDTSSAPQNNTF